MFSKTFIIICLTQILTINSTILDDPEIKPRLERNNIVNKGMWIRNNAKETIDKDIRNQRHRKSIATNNKIIDYESGDLAKSKIINDLKPTSFFNDYPYEVAILLNNNKNEKGRANRTPQELDEEPSSTTHTDIFDSTTDNYDAEFKITANDTIYNLTVPKRSMQYDFESDIDKKIEYNEEANKTDDTLSFGDNKVNDRNVFDKDNSEWHQNAPIPNINMYKVVPKEPQPAKSKPVTERGLIKVISMLTKTFKKIMRQHSEIKDIHSRISEMSEEFGKNTGNIASKFQDFDLKYLYILKFHDKLKEFDAKITAKEDYFKNKDKEMARNFKDFESQQKKFLQQQKQFYNIQKLMLAQNEKINLKQNLIAKTQSEISHRQNNFARILKKAKQLYIDSKNSAITKLSSSISKVKEPSRPFDTKVTHTSTQTPEITTDSIKINLFSIPSSNKIQKDPDELIMKDKDDQAIDDLVYKYYFNNTFIDSIMRSKVLNSFMGNGENVSTRNVKTKRNELKTTLLLPILEGNETEHEVNRERRWINHHLKRKNRRRARGKAILSTVVNVTDEKRAKNTPLDRHMPDITPLRDPIKEGVLKNDPFLTMATSFCNEIKQNTNQQVLMWCIEKALRRLQFLARMVPAQPPSTHPPTPLDPGPTTSTVHRPDRQQPLLNLNMIPLVNDKTDKYEATQTVTVPTTMRTAKVADKQPIKLTTPGLISTDFAYTNYPSQAVVLDNLQNSLHFPDNEELESNLKEFDIAPDTEGNVYYEGSFHISDLGKIIDSESQGVDDIVPGQESNSRVEVDPMTFDLQAKRRAFVRKLNERIKKSLG
ncbi:uncharacterized protein LOC142984854 isoform X2 [Anticarsia gemmatalis]|uniref:uncharacterized protein LOC142984854 isoform X2 n=1 Tax=Anticarsia gemmatalis TaxID=129554 RepID=UPI003F75CE9B